MFRWVVASEARTTFARSRVRASARSSSRRVAGEPDGLRPGVRERGLAREELELGRPLGPCETGEAGRSRRPDGDRGGRADEERRDAWREISRPPVHRANDRSRRILLFAELLRGFRRAAVGYGC